MLRWGFGGGLPSPLTSRPGSVVRAPLSPAHASHPQSKVLLITPLSGRGLKQTAVSSTVCKYFLQSPTDLTEKIWTNNVFFDFACFQRFLVTPVDYPRGHHVFINMEVFQQ